MNTPTALLGLLLLSMPARAQDARDIVAQADELMRGTTMQAEMTLEIIRPTWSRTLAFKTWGKGRDYTLTYITAPAKEKGQAFLKRNNELWNWVPAINRMIKVPPSMMGQAWMGSDFTNDDLIRESSILVDYNHTLLGEEVLGGKDCWMIELQPKEEAAVVWGKILLWIDQKSYIQYKVERLDEDGDLVDTQLASQVQDMGGRTIATRLEIVPADQPDKRTVMTIKNAIFDRPLADRFFSQQNLKKIR
jgi:outer membrane lipoprotein-sorting protein